MTWYASGVLKFGCSWFWKCVLFRNCHN